MGCGVYFAALFEEGFSVAAFASGYEEDEAVGCCECADAREASGYTSAYCVEVSELAGGLTALYFVDDLLEAGEAFGGLGV